MDTEPISAIEVFESKTLKTTKHEKGRITLNFNDGYVMIIEPKADVEVSNAGNLKMKTTLQLTLTKPLKPSNSLDEFLPQPPED